MKKVIRTILLASCVLLFSNNAFSADLAQAKQLCNNASPQQKQMAKAAGYDVDSLCSSLKQSTKPVRTKKDIEPAVIPRVAADAEDKIPLVEKETANNVKQTLPKFGYDLFAGEPTTQTPVANIPVPMSYQIGVGDSVKIQLYGKTNSSLELFVEQDGAIQFPELGPIYVAGLSYQELKDVINRNVKEQMIGVQTNITLGELRSIQVFILGESYKPGAYTISSLSTLMDALYVSGGVKGIGSLRSIQLKREGVVVASLDLYDLLLKGDTSDNKRLQSGDVIYIPSVKKSAAVAGEVVRPAIYELKNERSASEIIKLAGGFLPTAYPKASKIERVTSDGASTVLDVDLAAASGKKFKINNGDRLTIYSALEKKDSIVTLLGEVYRPGMIAWKKGMKVSDVLPSAKVFKDNANISAILVMREVDELGTIHPIQVNYREIMQDSKSEENIALQNNDDILVLTKLIRADGNIADTGNAHIKNYTEILEKQSSFLDNAKVLQVSGFVKFPGKYPLTRDMSVQDAVLLAGGLSEGAYGVEAEITRRTYLPTGEATIVHLNVNLQEEFLSDSKTQLKSHDELRIKVTPEYREIGSIELIGEIKFPGRYKVYRGETLSNVVKRAGGFTNYAHSKAAVFSRKALRIHEQREIERLQAKLRQELAAAQLEDSNIGKVADIQSAEFLLDELGSAEASGRLVIDLDSILSGEEEDLVLKAGDRLMVPAYKQEVTVIGEVQVPTSHLYNTNYSFTDYIERSGDIKETADDERIYIVKANGSVVIPNNSSWFSQDNVKIESGDTIVVPLDTSRVDGLELWSKVSTIVYQLALGAAAINSF